VARSNSVCAAAPGDRILLALGSANNDEDVFSGPTRCGSTGRTAASILAFGYGMHRCLGAFLARQRCGCCSRSAASAAGLRRAGRGAVHYPTIPLINAGSRCRPPSPRARVLTGFDAALPCARPPPSEPVTSAKAVAIGPLSLTQALIRRGDGAGRGEGVDLGVGVAASNRAARVSAPRPGRGTDAGRVRDSEGLGRVQPAVSRTTRAPRGEVGSSASSLRSRTGCRTPRGREDLGPVVAGWWRKFSATRAFRSGQVAGFSCVVRPRRPCPMRRGRPCRTCPRWPRPRSTAVGAGVDAVERGDAGEQGGPGRPRSGLSSANQVLLSSAAPSAMAHARSRAPIAADPSGHQRTADRRLAMRRTRAPLVPPRIEGAATSGRS